MILNRKHLPPTPPQGRGAQTANKIPNPEQKLPTHSNTGSPLPSGGVGGRFKGTGIGPNNNYDDLIRILLILAFVTIDTLVTMFCDDVLTIITFFITITAITILIPNENK